MRGTFLIQRTIVCTSTLLTLLLGAALLGAAQAQTQAAPTPGFDLVSDHVFTPLTLPAAVQLDQSVLYFPAGVCSGFHTHGGPGMETVLSGEIVVSTKSTATTPESSQTYKTGEAYTYQAGVAHNVCNMTNRPATFTSAFLLLDGAALVTPVK